MKLKSKSVLFCGEVTASSRLIIKTLLQQNIKSLLIANKNEVSLDILGFADSRLTYFGGDLTKIEDLEVIYTEALKRTKKKVDIVVNYTEIIADDVWEDLITTHINSLICSTLMAMKHLGSMNSGRGGIVVNSLAIFGQSEEDYASIHRLLTDLNRSFSDPYYFNSTAVRILTMCVHMEIGRGSGSDAGSPVASLNVSTEAIRMLDMENANPQESTVSFSILTHKKPEPLLLLLVDKFLEIFTNTESYLQPPQLKQTIEEFEISVRN